MRLDLDKRFTVLALMAIVALALPATVLGAAGDWAQFRESQTRQGNTNDTTLSTTNVGSLGVAWTGATGGAVNSSPARLNNRLYVGSSDGKLYVFDAACATGGAACTPLWTGSTGGAIDSSPAAVGTRVYVGSSDGKLYAFPINCAAASCGPVWTATTGGPIHSSPAVDAGVVYVGSSDGKLYAFGASCAVGGASCSPIWKASTGGAIESSPAVAGGRVYVGSNDGKLYAFAVGCASGGGTCSPLWTATTGAAIHASPAVVTGVVYVGSLDATLYAFDAAGVTGCSGSPVVCTPIWTGTTGGAIYSSAAIGGLLITVGSDDGKLYAFHVGCASGGHACTPVWTGATGGPVRSSPAYANNVLFVGSNDGKVYAFDSGCATATCTPLWSRAIGTAVLSSPTEGAGMVAVGSSDGKLYAFHLVVHHLVLSPASATIVAGATQAYLAEGFSSTNADLGDVTAQTVFTMSAGGMCTGNQCGATIGGAYTITGTYGAAGGTATGTATLHVSSSGATYVPIAPARVLDTRINLGLTGHLVTRVARTFAVAGQGGVPSNAVAVTGNLTVTEQTAAGFLYIGPTPQNSPTSSSLNFPRGDNRANNVTVALAVDGSLSVTYVGRAGSTTAAIFDVTGYFKPDATGATYTPISGSRVLDTRDGTGLSGSFVSHVARTLVVAGTAGIPANAVAITGNLTVTGQTAKGFLFIGPTPQDNPTSSTLNFPIRDNRANGFAVALGPGGSVAITYVAPAGATTAVVLDVTGYFTPDNTGATFIALAPTRLLDTRSGLGLTGSFPANVSRNLMIAGTGGVPSGAVAITGNLTVTQQTARGFLYMGPDQENLPTTSTLNFPTGDNRANGLTVALASDGSAWITYASSSGARTAVIFDVTGYFTRG